ncbi:hypothetical protein RJ55_02424 [Drechmeria coniospora]|nr:hypothetical protein RJ55_02424 [Drechmeria coniospora]
MQFFATVVTLFAALATASPLANSANAKRSQVEESEFENLQYALLDCVENNWQPATPEPETLGMIWSTDLVSSLGTEAQLQQAIDDCHAGVATGALKGLKPKNAAGN